jgi:hypothetical protein
MTFRGAFAVEEEAVVVLKAAESASSRAPPTERFVLALMASLSLMGVEMP